jgi:hypothetical protein
MTDDNSSNSNIWTRLLYMLLFAFLYSVAELVLFAVVVIQFLFLLITGRRNHRVHEFAGCLARYLYQVIRYLAFISDSRPFPFSDWPQSEAG